MDDRGPRIPTLWIRRIFTSTTNSALYHVEDRGSRPITKYPLPGQASWRTTASPNPSAEALILVGCWAMARPQPRSERNPGWAELHQANIFK
jgi:hypothetical protein